MSFSNFFYTANTMSTKLVHIKRLIQPSLFSAHRIGEDTPVSLPEHIDYVDTLLFKTKGRIIGSV